jgi:CheY-like chemotaxis protein
MDDDSAFLLLAKRLFRQAGVPPENITTCLDGVEAKKHLELAPLPPSLIFVDQKMPRVGGIEVLDWMRSRPSLRNVRTFMLSTSEDPEEVRKARALGVDGYLVKPMGLSELQELLTDVLQYCVSPDRSRRAPGSLTPP